MMFETQMRSKLAAAAVKSTKVTRPMLRAVSRSYNAGSGCKEVKPWNAHLSLRTYSKLKEDEVMA